MVKVVGKDSAVIKRVTCRKCSSILEYTLNEVQQFKSYDYGGGCEIVRYVSCPCCSDKVSVKGY